MHELRQLRRAKKKMNIENEEQDNCVQSITYGINRTADWRDKVYERYQDQRNLWAAKALRKLASDAHLTQESWEKLQPHFEWGSQHFREAVSQAARQVGFQHKSKSFPFFVKYLVSALPGLCID